MNVDEMLINNRVCPNPMVWHKLWEMIQKESKDKIETPLILAAWYHTTNEDKTERFLYHIEKAKDLNLMGRVKNLLNIQEDEWHHINE